MRRLSDKIHDILKRSMEMVRCANLYPCYSVARPVDDLLESAELPKFRSKIYFMSSIHKPNLPSTCFSKDVRDVRVVLLMLAHMDVDAELSRWNPDAQLLLGEQAESMDKMVSTLC